MDRETGSLGAFPCARNAGANHVTAPGSSPGRASGPVSVGMSDLELGYPVCAGAGAECTLSGSAGDFGPDGPVVVFLLCYHH
jgi:hypothetical protein